jgi:hypothetical protein
MSRSVAGVVKGANGNALPVRKKMLVANPCSGVEFPVRVKGLFRPHYMKWSEQETIERAAPP